ncbi:MAG TPA: HlyD family secretion protein [Stellaceae bacterium]|nr:HlyD family secretion protein [Stellaceae bacterium]
MAVATDTRAAAGARVSRRPTLRYTLMAVVPAAIVLVGGYWYLTAGRYAETDDAYAQADTVAISSDVGGRVTAIDVHDNEPVKAGQPLIGLDDSNYRIALERAEAQLASARLQVDGLRAAYREKLAEEKQAQDTLNYQQTEFNRQQSLFSEHVTSQSGLDAARHQLDMARQQVASTQEELANTVAALGGNPDIATNDHPLVRQAQAQVDQARLDLFHTIVLAPLDGTVTNVDKLPVGQYLNASTPAFSLVANDTWIEANFKETDLTHMRPGQKATVDIDTYPDHTFTAVVQSIGAGTGSEFSVLPPQNASGNWVKVVQRIPVRLKIEDPDPERPLRAGMSADVEVDTGYRSPLLIKLESFFGR